MVGRGIHFLGTTVEWTNTGVQIVDTQIRAAQARDVASPQVGRIREVTP